jgi:N-acetylmuramoyl-L-alanine amidase/YARHG domain
MSIARKRIAVIAAGAVALVGGLATFVGNLETLHSKIEEYRDKQAYLSTRKPPFPSRLKPEDIAGWSSGRLKLALYQIDGYLGKLKTSPPWLRQCLTSETIFPVVYAAQFNERYELTESEIDRHNRMLIQKRIDQIEIEKIEDRELLRINDPFVKLLMRSSKQLLSAYQESEIAALDKAHLYLLRNAIFGQHGYKFDTAKLAKFAHRMGWSSSAANIYKASDVSPLERCNAFFLEQLHPGRELGALGRGILLRPPAAKVFPSFLLSSLCTCLAKLKHHVDCRRISTASDRTEFHEFVDLIIEFVEGDANKAEWTFLSDGAVEDADVEIFRPHQDRFFSSALDFNVAIQSALAARDVQFTAADEHRTGAHWGVKLTLTPSTLETLRRDPILSRDVSAKMCSVIHDSLELAGPYIPRTIETMPARLQIDQEILEVFDKPIVFNDLRIKLTKEYAKIHYGVSSADIEFIPRMIVIHRTGLKDLKESLERMQPVSRPSAAGSSATRKEEVNGSAHYLVDRDGTVYSLMKESYIARHVVGLDRHAIGIQNVGQDENALTDAQVVSNAKLVRFLRRKYDTIKWLVGNSESFAFDGAALWEEKQAHEKVDGNPGAAFMTRLRKRVADLDLKATP